ncbi:MAG: hypothetical protein D6781_04395 [Verrucomicrobia bacterium]|nr:MAG: hypothetical protein D6781_04395 [Verrucomicrobiota bacterium]
MVVSEVELHRRVDALARRVEYLERVVAQLPARVVVPIAPDGSEVVGTDAAVVARVLEALGVRQPGRQREILRPGKVSGEDAVLRQVVVRHLGTFGWSAARIGRAVGISERTVRRYFERVG